METMEIENPILERDMPEPSGGNRKNIIIIIILIAILLFIITGVILFFLLRNNGSEEDTPFDKIVKEDSEIHLIPKSGKYDYILIFMHGLLGSPNDFLNIFNKKDGPIPDTFKIILPCAPVAYVTRLNFNTTSWFDLLGENNAVITEKDIVFKDMDENSKRIKQLIVDEAKAINNDYRKVFVGGFSQGACMTFHIGLSFNHTLGGIIPFCGIPVSNTSIYENRENLNIFSILGGKDIYFPLENATKQIETILADFHNLSINVYENEEHTVSAAELKDVKKYIKNMTQI